MAGLTAGFDLAHERGQFLRFLGAGAANTVFAFAIYAAGIALGLGFALASLAAVLAGIATGFVLQGRIAFRAQLAGRFVPFVALWTLLYVGNVVIIAALASFGTDLYLCGLISAVPVNALSYLALRGVIFAPQPVPAFRMALLWLLGMVFVARLFIVTHLAANWDEFLNLSMIYDYRRGDTAEIFQTSFVHLFQWLPRVGVNEVDQIVAARLVMLGCAAATSLAIYHAARRFFAVEAALVAVLAYNCFGAALLYGTDFRTDTLATAAMLGAIALATHRRAGYAQMVAIGVLVAAAGACTIKAVFFLPTIGVLVLANAWAAGERARSARAIAAGALASAAGFAAILALHAATLGDTASATGFIGRTGGATLLTGDYRVLAEVWPRALIANLGFWLLLVLGALAVARGEIGGSRIAAADRVALAAFAPPLLVPLVYSEVYPYFHPFLIAPAAVLAGAGCLRIETRYRWLAPALLCVGAASQVANRLDQGLADQRFTLALVHRLFPAPVPYIDHTSMVSSFPKKGPFMSRWGMADYRAGGTARMPGIIAADRPAFLLETRSLLAVDRIDPEASEASPLGLFGADIAALRGTYTRYWGPLFLPGTTVAGRGLVTIAIGGRYRIEGDGSLRANGRDHAGGERVVLAPGRYPYSARGSLRLVWDAPPAPSRRPPEALFSGW